MYVDLTYDPEKFTGLTIKPEEKEDPDMLCEYAKRLMIKNPAIVFTELAKAGRMNDMCDEDYEQALKNIKLVSAEFFGSNAYANVFHVLDAALTYILSQRDPIPEDAGENESNDDEVDETVDEFEDDLFLDDIIDPQDDDDDD